MSEQRQKNYLKVADLACELGIDLADAELMFAENVIPVIRPQGRQPVISRAALEAYRRRLQGEPRYIIEIDAQGNRIKHPWPFGSC